MTSRKPTRRTAHEREMRRHRIMQLFKGGMPFGAIASSENLSAERVRQIVVKSLENDREALRDLDVKIILAARLEPAFQLAARGVIEGRLEAVGAMVKVIDRMAKFSVPLNTPRNVENIRAKLLAKLNMHADRMFPRQEEKNTPEPPATP